MQRPQKPDHDIKNMALQRFIGSTTSDSLKQVRQKVGDDALVLSTRDTPNGVEIIAISPAEIASLAGGSSSTTRRSAAASHDGVSDQKLFAMIAEMRELLRSRAAVNEWAALTETDFEAAESLRLLLNAGFSEEIAGMLADELKSQSQGRLTPLVERVQALIEERIARLEPIDTFDRGGIFPLIGSTGVGKTTVAAKIAARCALRYGRDNVALLTTDTFRIGAQDQIRVYANIIGIPMATIRDGEELAARLAEFANRKIVLIDTAGMSQRDLKMLEQIKLLQSGAENAHPVLVLSSTVNRNTLEDVILMHAKALRQTADAKIHSVIITKTDEAAQLGPALDCVIRHKLPLLFLANGQKVPEDLSPADIPYLVFRALHPRLVGEGLEYTAAKVPLLMMDQLAAWAIQRKS